MDGSRRSTQSFCVKDAFRPLFGRTLRRNVKSSQVTQRTLSPSLRVICPGPSFGSGCMRGRAMRTCAPLCAPSTFDLRLIYSAARPELQPQSFLIVISIIRYRTELYRIYTIAMDRDLAHPRRDVYFLFTGTVRSGVARSTESDANPFQIARTNVKCIGL